MPVLAGSQLSAGPSPTLNDLIEETRSYLYSNDSPEANRLQGPMLASDVTATFQFSVGTMSQRPCIIACDLELMRVWSAASNTASIIERGVLGSTPASHLAGAYVEVMPKFSAFAIQRAINHDLDDLASPWNGLYALEDLELTFNPAVSGYDMTDVNTGISVVPSNVLAIQELRYKIPGPSKHLPAIRRFDVARSVPQTDYPSGMALLLFESAFPGLPIHVRYRSRFQHLQLLTDDVRSVSLLPPEAFGLPALGAAIELMVGREIKRNFTEATTDPLQLELVTGGQVLNSYKGLMLQRQARIQTVAAGLLKQNGHPLRVL